MINSTIRTRKVCFSTAENGSREELRPPADGKNPGHDSAGDPTTELRFQSGDAASPAVLRARVAAAASRVFLA